MVISLYGAPTSWNTLRARYVLFELGLTDIKFITLSLAKGEQKTPEHLARNPFGKIPVLVDGDLTLFESRAIARYMAQKIRNPAAPLIPDSADIAAIGLFERAASVELTHFDHFADPLVLKHVRARFQRTSVPEDETSNALKDLTPKLDILDDMLSSQTFMAGKDFTLIDTFYMPLVYLLVNLGFQDLFLERSHLKRWWETVSERDAWTRAVEPLKQVYGF